MKKKFKTALCLLLALTMAIPTGCGKSGGENEKMNKDSVFSEEEINVNFPENFEINQIVGNNDLLLIAGYSYNDQSYESVSGWYTVKPDGSDFRAHEGTANEWIDRALLLSSGKIALFKSVSVSDESDPENFYYENFSYLDIMDVDGNVISEIDINKDLGIDYIQGAIETSDGNILLSAFDGFTLVDTTGKIISKKKLDNNDVYEFYKTKDGSIFTYFWGENGREYAKFDEKTLEKGEVLTLPFSPDHYSVCGSSAQYDMILSDLAGLYSYNLGDTEPKEFMNFVNSNIPTSNISNLVFLDDGSFFGTYYDWGAQFYATKLSRFVKVDPSTIPDKDVLTLGCVWISDEIRRSVIDFNKKSDTIHVNIKDYSKYESEENWNGGVEKLNSDIASGQGPDILAANDPSMVSNFISKGLFQDLTEYIENDPEIKKEDIFPNLLEACSRDGKLYEIVPFFYIETLVGKTKNLNGRTSWNFDEFMDVYNNLPEGMQAFSYMTRESLLTEILSVNSADFIDTEKSKCTFDSDVFKNLLTLVKDFPSENDGNYWENYDYSFEERAFREDKALLGRQSLSSVEDYRYLKYGTFGDEITFIGYPGNSGNGSALYYYNTFAVSSKCKNKDSAWEYIRFYLTPEYQSTVEYGIPASMSRFDELCKKSQTTQYDEDGQEVWDWSSFYYINDQEIKLPKATDEDIATFKNFIMSVSTSQTTINDILPIIYEEAEPFFEGQKSVDEVVKIIQSRVSIFLSEKQ